MLNDRSTRASPSPEPSQADDGVLPSVALLKKLVCEARHILLANTIKFIS